MYLEGEVCVRLNCRLKFLARTFVFFFGGWPLGLCRGCSCEDSQLNSPMLVDRCVLCSGSYVVAFLFFSFFYIAFFSTNAQQLGTAQFRDPSADDEAG